MERDVMTNIKNKFRTGFTIIELLVVIVIIGILATIGFVSYGGLQAKARDSSVMSDLDTMDALQTSYGLKNNTVGKAYYSGNGPDVVLGFTASSGNVIDVVINSSDYCIRGYNTSGTKNSINNAFIKESSVGVCNQLPASNAATGLISLSSIAAITGTPQVGQVLTAGALTPLGATASYQWQSSATSGGTYTNISGATSSTYTLVSGDVGKYIKVVATGTGSYSGSATSAATTMVAADPWYSGIAATALAGKHVYKTDLGSTYQYKTANTAVASPQGATGLDPNWLSMMSLVSPQTNPGVDFSAYPAQNACKAIGGRLPNMQELLAIYDGQASYGNNFQASGAYWSSTESDTSTGAYYVNFSTRSWNTVTSKTNALYVRCVSG